MKYFLSKGIEKDGQACGSFPNYYFLSYQNDFQRQKTPLYAMLKQKKNQNIIVREFCKLAANADPHLLQEISRF